MCPDRLVRWEGFLDEQRHVFDLLHRFPRDARVFMSRDNLASDGEIFCGSPVGSDKALGIWMHNAIDAPLRWIIRELSQTEGLSDLFNLGKGIRSRYVHDDTSSPSDPVWQICSRQTSDGTYEAVYVAEYIAPYKLTSLHLRAGLRPMDVYTEIVNGATMPPTSDDEAVFKYHAERLAAAALAQTYQQMIENGLQYGLFSTGEAMVFLKVDWANPGVLQYHLAEPGPEVADHQEYPQARSAVGQCLAFSLMALGQPGARMQRPQDERDKVAAGLRRWAVDLEAMAQSMPDSSVHGCSSSGLFYRAPTTYREFNRLPRLERRLQESTVEPGN